MLTDELLADRSVRRRPVEELVQSASEQSRADDEAVQERLEDLGYL